MAQTFGDLQAQAAGDDFTASKWTGVISQAINDALDDIARQASLPLLESTFTVTTVAGTATYAIPADDVAILSAFDATTRVPLGEVTREWIDEQNDVRGRPYAFAQYGGQVVLYPTPDQAYSDSFRYMREVANLTGSGDLVSAVMPDSYANAVVAFARHRLFRLVDDKDMSAFWRTEYERDLGRIKGDLGRRRPRRQVPGMWRRVGWPRFARP